MKKLCQTFKVMSLLFIALLSTSCDNDDDAIVPIAPQEQTIATIASNNSEFTSLVAALNRAGLTATLNSSGNFTVFAPTNAAFDAFLDANNFINLEAVPIPLLREVLLNHVIADELFANELTTTYVKTLATGSASSNKLSMFVDTSSGVKLNGVSTVTLANINASNGVIHKVNAVIGLPTIVTHATANSNFSSLVAALTRSDQTDQNFVGILSGTASSPFTVFAPTNSAFGSLLTEFNWTDLNAVPETVLENTLKYHVVAGTNILASEIPNTATNITTFQGQTFSVNATGGAKITDQNSRVSNIIATDVQCDNGVIHVLDKVIVPNLN